jgi:uncharacterized beta-barrel protein YwiB (DUF1934 family)
VKKTVIIDRTELGLTADFTLELREKGDISNPMSYTAGTTTVTIVVEGYDKLEYEIWIDDIMLKAVTIDFSDGLVDVEIKLP